MSRVAPGDLASMAEVRAAIDGLDRALLARLAERARLVARAVQLGAAADDFRTPGEDVSQRMRADAEAVGFDPERAERIVRVLLAQSPPGARRT